MPESFWQRNEVEAVMSQVTLADRLLLMTQLAFAFAVLHKQDWVIGDFSFQNAAFALDPPRLLLIDCDDAASLSDQERRQPHTPQWAPPECQGSGAHRHQDHQTDVYKLGLAIVRYLRPEKGATTTFDPERLVGILDSTGLSLVRSALSEDRDARPTAREIFEYLKRFTDPMIASPVINYAELITPVVLRDAGGHRPAGSPGRSPRRTRSTSFSVKTSRRRCGRSSPRITQTGAPSLSPASPGRSPWWPPTITASGGASSETSRSSTYLRLSSTSPKCRGWISRSRRRCRSTRPRWPFPAEFPRYPRSRMRRFLTLRSLRSRFPTEAFPNSRISCGP